MDKWNALRILFAIIVSEFAGLIGSVVTFPSITTWYVTLSKPSFNPPNWVFAPVWLVLFALMGIAAGMIWNRGLESNGVKTALFMFSIQLILNALWSTVFFGMHSLLYGFVIIIGLWIAIAVTMVLFLRISGRAGLLLLPYIGWVTFAAILNLYILTLNP